MQHWIRTLTSINLTVKAAASGAVSRSWQTVLLLEEDEVGCTNASANAAPELIPPPT